MEQKENVFENELKKIAESLTQENSQKLSSAFDAVFDAKTGKPIPCGHEACISLIELLSELTGMESNMFGTSNGFMNMYRMDLAWHIFHNR